MLYQFWLTFHKDGSAPVARKTRPHVGPNQIAVAMAVELPDALFQRPTLSATVTINEDQVPALNFDANTQGAIEGALAAATGLEFRVSVAPPDQRDAE